MMLEGRLIPPKGKIILNVEAAGEGVETAPRLPGRDFLRRLT